MSARAQRRSTAATISLTAGITAGAALMLCACGPTDDGAAAPAPPATSAGRGSGSGVGATPAASGKPARSTAPAPLNGTAHNGLTISDGTRYVVMNGGRVDFGTQVRDLAWSPDGRKAVFVDGHGDLAVSNPDGTGRVVVAANPGGQNWSHPTWQVRAKDPGTGYPPANEIFFAVRAGGVSRLYGVSATARHGTPEVLNLSVESGENVTPLPQTGNVWPSAAGRYGAAAYANTDTGAVYIRDDYLRQQGSVLTSGSQPAMANTDDADVVFVRSVEGHDHLFLEHPTDAGPTYRDLTPDATTDYTEPAFSPDGEDIAARTPAGIVVLPADGSHPPVKVSDHRGLPAYRAS